MFIENLNLHGTPIVAKVLCTTTEKVRRLIDNGDLPGYKIGGEYKVAEKDLVDYLERARVKPHA